MTLVSLAGELAGDREAIDPRPDDAGRQSIRRRRHFAPGLATVIRRHALQVADADRRVDFLTPACFLARTRAHATETTREDIVLPVELEAIGVATVGDERDIAGDIGVRRARGHTRDVVREPLRIARVDRVALARAFGIGRKEGGVDKSEEANAAGILDLRVKTLTDDAAARKLAGRHADFGWIHRAVTIRRRPAGGTLIRRRRSLVDPSTDLAAKHDRSHLPALDM